MLACTKAFSSTGMWRGWEMGCANSLVTLMPSTAILALKKTLPLR